MRTIVLLLIITPIISFSSYLWAASCERCFEVVADGEQFCEECALNISKDYAEMASREKRIIDTMKLSRDRYKNALTELVQFYLDTGNQLRLQKARRELQELNRIPVVTYSSISSEEMVPNGYPSKNIEEANTLFRDGKMYVNPLNLVTKKTRMELAVARFKKILDDYPQSDIADDAAYELANLYEGYYFKDYESAAYYYIKCYDLNKNTDKPATFMAAMVYDEHLKDYAQAVRYYEMALSTCKNTNLLKTAKSRLEELRKQGF